MKHVLSVLVENRPGVLSRVTGLISRRGFNIESLAVGPTEDAAWSRITIVVHADTVAYDQIIKQLNKLVSVFKITDLTNARSVERELAMFKIAAEPQQVNEIRAIIDVFRAKIVDVSADSMIIEATGDSDKLLGLEDLLRVYGIKEIVRTGRIAIGRL